MQFFVDGNPNGPEDTASPYAANWDTRLAPNGAHTLTARARDTDNKTTLSALVNVTTANSDYFQNQVLATGFTLPTSIEFLPDGRLLVAELAGKIRSPRRKRLRIPGFSSKSATSPPAVCSRGSTTSLSIPISPATTTTTSSTRSGCRNVDRLRASQRMLPLTGTVPGSELTLYQDPFEADIEHHGGAITFGNDGKIYFTTGEHFQGTPAQNLASSRGKIHRIDKDGFVPLDNPFYDGAGPNWDSVWAYGLRNPFRAYSTARAIGSTSLT